MANQPGTSRPLIEVALSFLGALLVIPLALKTIVSTVRGLLRLGIVRRLLGEAVIVGLTTLLTRQEVLDFIFGERRKRKSSQSKSVSQSTEA